jgi:ABC-type antimicrobial peptide transport system permease subunit
MRNILVILGVAVSTAVLTGALFIGDSLRYSLEQITLSRLGNTTYLITAGDRFFTERLADSIARATGIPAAPVLQLEAVAVSQGGEKRASHVQVTGIDFRFEPVSGYSAMNDPGEQEIIVSDNLARELEVETGDYILLRIGKASLVPGNAPFVAENDATIPFRAKIRAVVTPKLMGNFNLRNSQLVRFNVFMSLDKLNSLMEFEGRANRILLAGNTGYLEIADALKHHLTPLDAGLLYKSIEATDEAEITSERIFLEEKITSEFKSLPGSRVLMSWFVNTIGYKGQEIPYSFAASWQSPLLENREAFVNEWAAKELGLKAGDTIKVKYFTIGSLRQLDENGIGLTVREVVPLSGPYADRELAPKIPGLSDAGHCREWNAGVPIDLDKIRDRDEAYWNRWGGTPKLFVSPALADSLWANRFGNSTSVRLPAQNFPEEEFTRFFKERFSFPDFGFEILPVRETGLKAANQGVDFGQLFLGLSFFLLVAAMILTSTLFRLNIETRVSQVGTLAQLGFTPNGIRKVILSEGMAIAVSGVITGLFLAVVYVHVILSFLDTLWWDIVRTSMISPKIRLLTTLLGALISLVAAWVSIRIPLHRFLKRTVVSLHRNDEPVSGKGRGVLIEKAMLLLFAGATGSLVLQLVRGAGYEVSGFFVTGALMLSALLLFVVSLWSGKTASPGDIPEMKRLWLRMIVRNRRRSVAIVVLFALGTFIVLSTGANRRIELPGSGKKSSGTGGFSSYAETSVPVLFDLNDRERRIREGMDTTYRVVQFSKLEGDDASCLNLNRVSNPSLLGVHADELKERFTFVSRTSELDLHNPWNSLKTDLQGGVYPAVADQTVIKWGLGMNTGDTLFYRTESGDTLKLKLIGGLAPSVFQGNLLIDHSVFSRFYPTHSGSLVFLVEGERENDSGPAGELENLLRDHGIEIVPASRRLAEFNSVTNTYLSIFMALGFLGVILGTIGLSVILARSVYERRHELAILSAVGYTKFMLAGQIVREYGLLLLTGVGIGFISSIFALIPGWLMGTASMSAGTLVFMFVVITIHGLFWLALLASFLIRTKQILPALKNE